MNEAESVRIFYPVFAMFLLVSIVLLRMRAQRFGAVRRQEVDVAFYKAYPDGGEPESLRVIGRHFANLFEMPVLFYAVVLMIYVTHHVNGFQIACAWLYVALRWIHTYIHLGSNDVVQRFSVYFGSAFVLALMWATLLVQLLRMNPAVALCPHLRADDLARLSLDADGALDWWGGPVTAVARCEHGDGSALLELLDWSRSHRVRIFALAAIDRAAIALFLRNRARGSCDLSRADREVEALFASAGAVERVIALDAESNAVLASMARPEGLFLPAVPWRERLLPESDASWFARLGLDKAAS